MPKFCYEPRCTTTKIKGKVVTNRFCGAMKKKIISEKNMTASSKKVDWLALGSNHDENMQKSSRSHGLKIIYFINARVLFYQNMNLPSYIIFLFYNSDKTWTKSGMSLGDKIKPASNIKGTMNSKIWPHYPYEDRYLFFRYVIISWGYVYRLHVTQVIQSYLVCLKNIVLVSLTSLSFHSPS